MKIETPELDKVLAVHDQSRAIGEFLDWLERKGLKICEEGTWYPVSNSIQSLLAKYFEIDEQKCELERRALLAEIPTLVASLREEIG